MGRTVLITGASRGIGATTASLAAERGYSVAINYATNDAAAKALVDAIAAKGGKAIAVKGDVANEADIAHLFDSAESSLGPIMALVNNAGVPGKIGRVENVAYDVLKRTFEVNVYGAFLAAREFIGRASMKHGGTGGAIVNVSSMASKTGSPNELVHYAAAKAAVETFSYGLAAEVAAEGIRVNTVSCGLIETGIHAEAGDASRLQRYATRMPMQRPGQPAEVAHAILWLLSDEASYVTGATLAVAGGR